MEFDVERLFSALHNLNQSVGRAKSKLENNCPDDEGLRERIANYEEIIRKQTKLAISLKAHLALENNYEIARHVHLITSLTNFIYDDAQELSASLSTDRADLSNYQQERTVN